MAGISSKQSSALRPTILGKKFRLGDDPTVYWVGGIKGRTNDVVLQDIASEEIRIISAAEFLRFATPVDK